MQIPKHVLVTDVVARDGFQNEDLIVSTQDKLRVIEGLVRAGVISIEVTSFVHPSIVPQLADAADLVARLPRYPGVTYSALVPNIKGARRALVAGVTELHLVVSASESHNRANLNRSVGGIARPASRSLLLCPPCESAGRFDSQHLNGLPLPVRGPHTTRASAVDS
ncbi:MAG: hypothetical protein ACJ8BW_20850 [Ktedonobacteraceae bacterium]